MISGRIRVLNRRGFTAVELMVVIAIIGILAVVSVPTLVSYWRAATIKAAAEEMATGLSRARQLAISRNQGVCVEVVGNQYRYRLTNCGGAIWNGPGTDPNGLFTLASNVTLTTTSNPVFQYLGDVQLGTEGTFTVTNPLDGQTRSVVVTASGRVRAQ